MRGVPDLPRRPAGWNIAGRGDYGLVSYLLTSTPHEMSLTSSQVSNPDLVNGLVLYDTLVSEVSLPYAGHDFAATTVPGRWERTISAICIARQDGEDQVVSESACPSSTRPRWRRLLCPRADGGRLAHASAGRRRERSCREAVRRLACSDVAPKSGSQAPRCWRRNGRVRDSAWAWLSGSKLPRSSQEKPCPAG